MTQGEYFGTSGIRGHVGTDVDAELALTAEARDPQRADTVFETACRLVEQQEQVS